MNHWSRVAIAAAYLAVTGCADGAKIVQDGDGGGVAVYPFKGEQGHLLSSFRKDALSLMQQKCGGPYTIVREGETKSRARVAETVQGSQEMVQERRWGIEFRCK